MLEHQMIYFNDSKHIKKNIIVIKIAGNLLYFLIYLKPVKKAEIELILSISTPALITLIFVSFSIHFNILKILHETHLCLDIWVSIKTSICC